MSVELLLLSANLNCKSCQTIKQATLLTARWWCDESRTSKGERWKKKEMTARKRAATCRMQACTTVIFRVLLRWSVLTKLPYETRTDRQTRGFRPFSFRLLSVWYFGLTFHWNRGFLISSLCNFGLYEDSSGHQRTFEYCDKSGDA